MEHKITIIDGDPTTKKLNIDPEEALITTKGDYGSWSILPTSNVKYFLIKGKDGTRKIFKKDQQAPSTPVKFGRAKIKSRDIPANTIYKYSIFWTDNDDAICRYEFDPKIAVDPTIFGLKPKKVTVVSAIVGVLAIIFFLSIRKRKPNAD